MTGNTASFAFDLSRADWRQALHHLWPIPAFCLGLIFSAAITTAARRRGVHSSFSIALGTEFVLLAIFCVAGIREGVDVHPKQAGSLTFYALLSLAAAAMGVQTVTVTRVSGLRIYTTYLTGSLSKCAEAIVQYGFWFYDRTRGRFRRRIGKVLAVTPRIKYVHHAGVTAGLWVGFMGGALSGSLAEQRFGLISLACPLTVVAFAIGVDLIRPVAAADEAMERDSAH